MVNYGNGKIYKIECLTTGLIYVGSTTKQYLSQRLVHHRKDYNKYINGNGKYPFTTSFKILENDNYRIELLEEVNCESKDQLYAREGYYIRTLNCVNRLVMGKTDDDKTNDKKLYYQNNKERIKATSKDNYTKNIDRIKKYREQKYHCECGCSVLISGKSLHLKSKKHLNFINQLNTQNQN
jgi:hypothetical protein